jgi:hypothetical protein
LPNFYYVGNFDDEIRRYNPGELTLNAINDTLYHAVIAGGPLLINDGYLMHFHDGRLALTDPSASPLTELLKAGFVKLFSRSGGDLSSMPEKMQHIPTYERLLCDPDWEELKNKLLSLQSTLRSGAIVDWPKKDVGPGFRQLLRVALRNLRKSGLPSYVNEYSTEGLFNEFERTLDRNPKLAARTTWNKLIDEPGFQFSQEVKEYLHWIGIEAYHYNLAMVASVAFGGRPAEHGQYQQPGVLTRYSSIFSDFQLTLIENENGTPCEELPRPLVPVGFYEGAVNSGEFLAKVVETNGTLVNLKQRYLASLNAAIEDRHHLPDARNAADEYGRALSLSWIHDYPEREQSAKWVSVVISAGLGVLGAHVSHNWPIGGGALMGAMVGLAVDQLTPAVRETYHTVFRPQVPIAIKLIEPLERRKPRFDTLSSPIPPGKWSAFLPVNLGEAKSHFESLPTLQ